MRRYQAADGQLFAVLLSAYFFVTVLPVMLVAVMLLTVGVTALIVGVVVVCVGIAFAAVYAGTARELSARSRQDLRSDMTSLERAGTQDPLVMMARETGGLALINDELDPDSLPDPAESVADRAAVYLVESEDVTTYVSANDDATITALADAHPRRRHSRRRISSTSRASARTPRRRWPRRGR